MFKNQWRKIWYLFSLSSFPSMRQPRVSDVLPLLMMLVEGDGEMLGMLRRICVPATLAIWCCLYLCVWLAHQRQENKTMLLMLFFLLLIVKPRVTKLPMLHFLLLLLASPAPACVTEGVEGGEMFSV